METGHSVVDGVQESTFYSMNQSVDVNEKRSGQASPLTQVDTVYTRPDTIKVSLKKEDRNGTQLGSNPRRGKKPSHMK